MQFLALAADYDGTLAAAGQVATATQAALERLKSAGCSLILVTGRQLEDLLSVFPFAQKFDAIVAENGAIAYYPAVKTKALLGNPPSAALIQALRSRQVEPLAIGEVIVATEQPYEQAVQETIQNLGLAYQIILNKEAVMILPLGVNKATGLQAVLKQMALLSEQVVAVGDAENDVAMLEFCGWGVALANALPIVQQKADWVTQGKNGEGVRQLIDRILASKDRILASKKDV